MGIMDKLWFAFCLLIYPVWYAYEQHKKNKNKERILELISFIMCVDGFSFNVIDEINYMIQQTNYCVPQIVSEKDKELFWKFYKGFKNFTITKISQPNFELPKIGKAGRTEDVFFYEIMKYIQKRGENGFIYLQEQYYEYPPIKTEDHIKTYRLTDFGYLVERLYYSVCFYLNDKNKFDLNDIYLNLETAKTDLDNKVIRLID